LKYRAEIDGLRALAVVPVILFHAGFEIFNGGFVGVDVFFVISGYLITTILIEDIENDNFSLLRFYERRARRILPALFFVMLVCIPFAWMWMSWTQMADFSRGLVAVSLFVSNILFWRDSGYFEASADENPLLHTWSLAVEEQYYVLFPIFLFLAWRFGKHRVFWMIVVLAVISLALSEWGWRHRATGNFYLAPTRAWELFAGSVAAFVIQKRGVQSNNVLSLLGLAAVLFAVFAYDESTPFPSVYTLVPVLGVVLFILFAEKETIAAKILSTKILVGIGLVSYSAYLWHQPLFSFARIYLIENPTTVLMLFLSSLSVALAVLSWRFVERPFRGENPLIRKSSSVLWLSLGGVVLFVGLGLAGIQTNGFKYRFEGILKGDIGQLEFYEYMDSRYEDCEPRHIAENALRWEGFLRCKQSQAGDADWVLVGDSHAEHLFLGLAESNPTVNVAYYVFGDKPYLGTEKFRGIFDVIFTSKKRKRIFLTMNYVSQLTDSSELTREFGRVVDRLKNAGHEVVLVGDIPVYERHPQDCFFSRSAGQVTGYCRIPKAEADAQKINYDDALTQLSNSYDVRYYPIDKPLCNDSNCGMVVGDTLHYRDANHLNIPGSILIGEYLSGLLARDFPKNGNEVR